MLKIDKVIKDKEKHLQIARFFELFYTIPHCKIIDALFKLNVGEYYTSKQISIQTRIPEQTVIKTLVLLDSEWYIVNQFGKGTTKKYELNKVKLEIIVQIMHLLEIKAS